MPSITREELKRDIRGGNVGPLYLLFGPEDFLRDAAARVIADAVLKEAPLREFNESAFSLAAADVQQAIAAAEQLPMMAPRRVVRVTDFSRLRESDEEALARYVGRPAETAVVVFVAEELDKRRRLSKTLIEACASVEFAPLSDAEAANWARDRFKHLKATVDERALRQLVALAGTGLRRLAAEVDKLATAALPLGHVTVESVDELVGRSRELSNFELTDHLVARDRRRALETLRRLLDDGAEPVMLMGLLASSYHRLALAKDLMSRGAPEQEVFRVVSMPFNQRKDFLATARRADADELARRIRRIAEADLAIKTSLGGSGAKGARLQLEMLVCELSA
ncbi:MAG TPA: DNA polymerase III subunit delta [Pyrinomonadaceae bacterium]|nr:DNA polymerase III subunit delta [Pyrinomonadaceae bacterium]